MISKRTIFQHKKAKKMQLIGASLALLLLAIVGTAILTNNTPSPTKHEIKHAAFMAESDRCTRYFSAIEAKHNMPENILRAISTIESGRWNRKTLTAVTWPWTLNVDGRGHRYNSKKETIAALHQFKADGAKLIDVGCMQINLHFHPDAFTSEEMALEPRFNIEYAATLLSKHYKRTKNWKRAVARYHSGTPHRGQRYARKVMRVWDQINRELSQPNNQFVPTPVTKISMNESPHKGI